jgi:hypothetical protein
MTPRFRLAALAAILALLLSAATVPLVRDWHDIYRIATIDDPEHAGRLKRVLLVFPIYWFYVAAGLGSFLASLIALGSGEGLRMRSLFFFLILSDVIYAGIGGIGFHLSMFLLAPDLDRLHHIATLQHLSTFDRIWKWVVELPIIGLLSGLLFGNLYTRGFGFLIGVPTIIWLGVRRLSANGFRLRSGQA